MAFLEKTKRGLDWLQHGYLIVQLLSSGAVASAVKAMLVTYTHVPHVWITPLWLLTSAAMMTLLVFVGNRLQKRPEQMQINSASQTAAGSLAAPPKVPVFDAQAFFHQSYSGQLQAEVEANCRAIIQNQPPDEREAFIVKLLATGVLNFTYYTVWLVIFRSQVLALMELNQRLLRREEIKQFYDAAVKTSPAVYEHYTFDQWLDYLRSQSLMLEHPGHTFEITVRGKDFLKYMVHFSYTADQRFN